MRATPTHHRAVIPGAGLAILLGIAALLTAGTPASASPMPAGPAAALAATATGWATASQIDAFIRGELKLSACR